MSAVLKRHYSEKPLFKGKVHYQLKYVTIKDVRVKVEWYRFKEEVVGTVPTPEGDLKLTLAKNGAMLCSPADFQTSLQPDVFNKICEMLDAYSWTDAKYQHDPRLRFKKLRIAPAGRQKKAGDFL